MKLALALALVFAACGSHAEPKQTSKPVAGSTVKNAIDPAAHLETVSEEIGFLTADSSNVPGTLVRPGGDAKYPAIVFFAGSGPTDRDWNQAAEKTNTGKLLAEALASHGAIVVRFDKAMVGGNTTSLAGKTIDIYVDEMRAALSYLRGRPDVDTTHLYVLGHSEGGIHAMRTAVAEGDHIAGLLLISTSGRTMRDILVAQVTAQIEQKAPGQSPGIMKPFAQALDDFGAGKKIDPSTATPIPGLQMLLRAFMAFPEAGRGLLTFDPLPVIAKVSVPIFIFNGAHDVQVEATIDEPKLENAAKATNKDVTAFTAPEANHMLLHEPRTEQEVRKAMADGTDKDPDTLDEATVTAIVSWLAKH